MHNLMNAVRMLKYTLTIISHDASASWGSIKDFKIKLFCLNHTRTNQE